MKFPNSFQVEENKVTLLLGPNGHHTMVHKNEGHIMEHATLIRAFLRTYPKRGVVERDTQLATYKKTGGQVGVSKQTE